MGKPFREFGWDVTDVDWDGRFRAEIVTDILTWDYKAAFPQGHFDVVWASPDCTQYSRARTNAKTPRNFESADRLVAMCREIIDYFQPRLWFIENPDTGLLKKQGRGGGAALHPRGLLHVRRSLEEANSYLDKRKLGTTTM